jgi:hypothetical protein
MKCFAFVVLVFWSLLTVSSTEISQTIFDNSDNYEADYFNTQFEAGDQVQFAGTNRMISDFQFMYFAKLSNPPSGNEQARVRFYVNDGPATTNAVSTPGTLIYDSGSFVISTNIQTVEISDLSVVVPGDTLIWTVQFSGFNTNEHGGVLFYDPPAVGSSGDFLWERGTNGWTQVSVPGLINNLSARFVALPVPIETVQIESMQLAGDSATVLASATPGKFYWLEYKDGLGSSGWTTLNVPPVQALGDQVTLVDPSASDVSFRIYRVTQRDSGVVGDEISQRN